MGARVVLSVKNPAKQITRAGLRAMVETAEGAIEGEIPAENIGAGAVTAEKIVAGGLPASALGAGAVTAEKIAAGVLGVQILGIQTAVKTDQQSIPPQGWTTATGLLVSVTTAAGERVLVIAVVCATSVYNTLRVTRNSGGGAVPLAHTCAALGGSYANTAPPVVYLDEPGAGTHVYGVDAYQWNTYGQTGYFNRALDTAAITGQSRLIAIRLGPETA